jgi:uncharacterized NAD-dependent epimerase/dehydratase family protein
MAKLKVGIIDSGVDVKNATLMRYVVGGYNIMERKLDVMACDDEIGHGTACADLITRGLDHDELSLCIYKVCQGDISVRIQDFKAALKKALDDRVDILNCSLGTIDPDAKSELQEIVFQCADAGIILVCAWNDEGYTTWPAAFQNVISVKSGEQLSQDNWNWVNDKKNYVVFRGTRQRVQWKKGTQIFMGGSSFATPLCTRVIARALLNGAASKELAGISSYLEEHASSKNNIDLNRSTVVPWNNVHNKMRRVGLYPFYKETHGFIRFKNKLPFEIAWVADFKHSKAAGKNTNQTMPNCSESFYINAGLPKDSSGIDTIIVGYLDLAGQASGKDLLEETYEYAYQKKINVFSLLPSAKQADWEKKFASGGLWLETPTISYDFALKIIQEVPEKKAVDVPIIGVFGTSSQQGKFTLQLALRYELQKRGFRVGQIGTEHQSGCFGIDFTFPSGYGFQQSLKMPMDFHIPVLRRVMSEMDKGQFDCLIVGAQSGLINPNPYFYGGIFSELFFSATLPDRTILIRNKFDSEDYIRRTENYVHAKTGVPVYQTLFFEDLVANEKDYVSLLADRLVRDGD